jgi:protein-tyrosine-phosphatase/predicted ATP-grasp superfamily ATP-dependent carboligase
VPVTFADITGEARKPRSRAIQGFASLPDCQENPERFADALSQLIQAGRYDMLIPCSDPGLVAVARNYERLRSLIYVGCPPPEVVRLVLDKRETLRIARECGILVPATHDAPDLASLEGLAAKLRFPLIAKPASNLDKAPPRFKMRYFESFEDLRDAFLLDPEFGARNLLQEYCEGEGVGIETLIHRSEPVALFQHRRLKELPITGGGSVMSESEALNPKLAEQAIALLRKLNWRGVAMVEFRYDRLNDRPVLMEVNGRYWGSLPLAIHAGIDFPRYEWQLAHGRKPSVPASYPIGMRARWLSGDIRRLSSLFAKPPMDGFPGPSKRGELIRFVKDFGRPARPVIWSWSDPAPALDEFARTIKEVLRPGRRRPDESRQLGLRAAAELLRMRALRTMGLERDSARGEIAGARSVLFVCDGNIIRSPMAEALLRKHLANGTGQPPPITVSSAGMIANPEEPADSRARLVAAEFGVALDAHRPRRLTREMLDQADVIFLMDRLNEARMRVMYPDAKNKMFLLGVRCGSPDGVRGAEIPDPVRGSVIDVRRCYRAIDIYAHRLAEMLVNGQARGNAR